MTLNEILSFRAAFAELNAASSKLSAKAKWNLARNIKTTEEVAKQYEEQKNLIVRKYLPEGAASLEPGTPGHAECSAEIIALLAVKDDSKLLHFEFADIVRDDLEISSELIGRLVPLLDNTPS